jgi:hypothetical protein
VRILCLIISGFFFYMVGLLALVNEGPRSTKFIIVAVFSVPAFLFLLPGLDRRGGAHARRNIGIVLLGAAGASLLVIVQVALMLKDPQTAPLMRPDTVRFFSDYVSGAVCLALYLGVGLVLVLSSRQRA